MRMCNTDCGLDEAMRKYEITYEKVARFQMIRDAAVEDGLTVQPFKRRWAGQACGLDGG